MGLDYSINQSWSARLEYLLVLLDGFSTAAPVLNVCKLDNDIIRAVFNYKVMLSL